MNDNVTLRVNGRTWSGWTSVRIGAGIERLARDFTVEITRQWPGEEGTTTLQSRIKNGSKVDVLMGDELVVTGWVEATPVRYDAGSVSTGIVGRSLTADLIDCTAEPTQFRGQSLIQIAQALARPFGIEVVNSGAPSGVIPDVQPDYGETVMEVINKMLGQQQALAYDDPYGRLVIGGIGSAAGTYCTGARRKYSFLRYGKEYPGAVFGLPGGGAAGRKRR
ncbi:bacteriophage Mu P protein [Escherichia coli M056]|nr:bacteriophage Mu P protein [Escherichia coli M056]